MKTKRRKSRKTRKPFNLGLLMVDDWSSTPYTDLAFQIRHAQNLAFDASRSGASTCALRTEMFDSAEKAVEKMKRVWSSSSAPPEKLRVEKEIAEKALDKARIVAGEACGVAAPAKKGFFANIFG
jgi:hypothetical protein